MTLTEMIMENLEDVIYDKATKEKLAFFELLLNY